MVNSCSCLDLSGKHLQHSQVISSDLPPKKLWYFLFDVLLGRSPCPFSSLLAHPSCLAPLCLLFYGWDRVYRDGLLQQLINGRLTLRMSWRFGILCQHQPPFLNPLLLRINILFTLLSPFSSGEKVDLAWTNRPARPSDVCMLRRWCSARVYSLSFPSASWRTCPI